MKKTYISYVLGTVLMFIGASYAHAASSISITSTPPGSCLLAPGTVSVTGTATADTPPGQLNQYAVAINWGDGTTDVVLPKGSFDTATKPFSGSHNYTTPGTYMVVATVYHSSITGRDNVSTASGAYTVCIVSPLTITKTANTSETQSWTWSVAKTATTPDPVVLAVGEQYAVSYTVTPSATSSYSNWAVSGNINITNPAGNPSITVTVTDTLATDGTVPVTCPQNTVAPGTTLTCTYTKALPGPNNQLNTANVAVTGQPLLNGSATASVNFASASKTEVDDCAIFTDTNAKGPQGVQVCAGALPMSWNYSTTFGRNASADVELSCGDTPYSNTASFVTNTSSTTGSATKTVNFHIDCPLGCTLSQGYWKTHNDSFKGGAPTDATWGVGPLASLKEMTLFYGFGSTWFNTFWTAPSKGNAYYQLAHQYMAAKLNALKGTDVPTAVGAAMSSANTLFSNSAYTPSYIGGLKSNNALRQQYVNLAGILGNYNEGNAGVPACSEQNPT